MMRQPGPQPKAGEELTAGLVSWRRRRLECAGFEVALAEEIASDRRFDLHAVLELIDRGCAPELAARIFAPLGDPT